MAKFELRTWQKKAIENSKKEVSGIFLEAAGGRGKTICALEIAKFKKAKSILIINNKLKILKGWQESLEHYDFPDVTIITDKTLRNRQAKGEKFNVDILIVDEWQNMCSEANLTSYKKIKRKYTIGLSATPVRRKGTNFFGLEQTIYGKANPNHKWQWQTTHGKMVVDKWTASGLKWEDFRNYDEYVNNLPNFMGYDYIEKLEKAPENNGFKLTFKEIIVPSANPELIKDFKTYNLVRVNGKSAMAKQHFGKRAFMRYLNQTNVDIDFPKLKVVEGDTPTLLLVDKLISTLNVGTLIVTQSVSIAKLIKERNPHISITTGEIEEKTDSNVRVATQQTMGVGVDGLQHEFQVLIVLDPVKEDSGEYDDYRQLLWRITGSRQQHDCLVIELYHEE